MTRPGLETPEPVLSEESARALELPDLLRVVAEFAATDLGRARIEALAPGRDREQLLERRRRVDEIARALEQSRPVPSVEEPLRPLLDALEGPGDLEGRQLVRLGEALGAVRRALDRFLADPESFPSLALLAAELEPSQRVDELRRSIETTLDARGEVRDDASPELRSLRTKVRSQREQLYRLLGDYVEQHGGELAEDTITLRDDRLLVLLPSGSRGRLPGLVQGRSASGRSFYFEPLEAVEANNDLRQTAADEAQERRRLLARLVVAASELADEIAAHLEALAELDLLCASHDFARTVDGHFAELTDGELHLRGARHPLLEPALASARERVLGAAGHREPVVPLDLDLDRERRILVVTGPNAGGKTVALKTVGLLSAMNQCGLAVPAGAESALPILDTIVATVGDEQDLLSDRSTFSGRLQRLAEAWQASGPDSLVLLDELGSGTGPEEGTALSIALLEALVERGALGVIVTHLTPLAAAALDLEGAGCAAMEFDPRSKTPTFRLRPGPPAASEALALARRLGLPSQIIAGGPAQADRHQLDFLPISSFEVIPCPRSSMSEPARSSTPAAIPPSRWTSSPPTAPSAAPRCRPVPPPARARRLSCAMATSPATAAKGC